MADYTTIDNPELYFQNKAYTGDGSSNQVITFDGSENMKPDWVWIKNRSNAHQHTLIDSTRGVNKALLSNSSAAEDTDDQYGWLSSFDTNGFTTQEGSAASHVGPWNVNKSGHTYISWNWVANGGTTSSDSNGSITSTVQANPTAGFCICSWTGDGSDATIGHGLGAVPKMIIHKHRSGSVQWNVYHVGTGTGGYLRLDSTNAFASNSGFFGTAPTSSVFSPGSHSYMSGNGNDNIAYIFADVQGYSKLGSYTGNGSTDGTFIYTGFKPAWLMFKRTDASGNAWIIVDNKRNTFNPEDKWLAADSSNAEATHTRFDFLSNGFKARQNYGNTNASGGNYIYMAFAENPFVTAGTKAAGTAR